MTPDHGTAGRDIVSAISGGSPKPTQGVETPVGPRENTIGAAGDTHSSRTPQNAAALTNDRSTENRTSSQRAKEANTHQSPQLPPCLAQREREIQHLLDTLRSIYPHRGTDEAVSIHMKNLRKAAYIFGTHVPEDRVEELIHTSDRLIADLRFNCDLNSRGKEAPSDREWRLQTERIRSQMPNSAPGYAFGIFPSGVFSDFSLPFSRPYDQGPIADPITDSESKTQRQSGAEEQTSCAFVADPAAGARVKAEAAKGVKETFLGYSGEDALPTTAPTTAERGKTNAKEGTSGGGGLLSANGDPSPCSELAQVKIGPGNGSL